MDTDTDRSAVEAAIASDFGRALQIYSRRRPHEKALADYPGPDAATEEQSAAAEAALDFLSSDAWLWYWCQDHEISELTAISLFDSLFDDFLRGDVI